jgi:hypothetical protein
MTEALSAMKCRSPIIPDNSLLIEALEKWCVLLPEAKITALHANSAHYVE